MDTTDRKVSRDRRIAQAKQAGKMIADLVDRIHVLSSDLAEARPIAEGFSPRAGQVVDNVEFLLGVASSTLRAEKAEMESWATMIGRLQPTPKDPHEAPELIDAEKARQEVEQAAADFRPAEIDETA